jgi:hypothetical protein
MNDNNIPTKFNRKTLQDELNRLNEGYHKTKIDMEKLNATPEQMRSLSEKRKSLEANLREQFADDLSKLNEGKSISMPGSTVSNVPMTLNQSKIKDLANTPLVGKDSMFKKIAKKFGGGLPVVGTIMGGAAALESGDAMAAIPGLDSAESVGMSADQEKMMLADDQAMRNYFNSPSSQMKEQGMSEQEKKARRQALVKTVLGR